MPHHAQPALTDLPATVGALFHEARMNIPTAWKTRYSTEKLDNLSSIHY